jgi:membrane protein YqaA with SNARE-associated domain
MCRMSLTIRNCRAAIGRCAQHPHASFWLFTIACIEASLFPVPPDMLLLALCLANPSRSIRFAAICTAGSVTGAFLGYAIGSTVFDSVGTGLLSLAGVSERFTFVLERYREHAWLTLIVAGFTPIPFAVFSLAAGFHGTIGFWTFAPAVLVGRSVRFFLVGGLLRFVGPQAHITLIGILQKVAVVAGVLFVLGVLTMSYLL